MYKRVGKTYGYHDNTDLLRWPPYSPDRSPTFRDVLDRRTKPSTASRAQTGMVCYSPSTARSQDVFMRESMQMEVIPANHMFCLSSVCQNGHACLAIIF